MTVHIDLIPEIVFRFGARSLWQNARPVPGQYRPKDGNVDHRKVRPANGRPHLTTPDRKDHALHRLWSRLGVKNGHILPIGHSPAKKPPEAARKPKASHPFRRSLSMTFRQKAKAR